MADDKMSNWGRWGADDQRGTLNLIGAKHIQQAAGLVRRGKVYSLAVLLDKDGPIATTRSPLWHRTTISTRPAPSHSGIDDIIVMHTHGTTHIDALCHIFYDNQMYNGYRVDEVVTPINGAGRNGVHNIGSIVGRGVLLDVAGYRSLDHLPKSEVIGPAELDACARAQGVEIMAGDIVLIRTGWMRVFSEDRALFDSGSPGPGAQPRWWRQ